MGGRVVAISEALLRLDTLTLFSTRLTLPSSSLIEAFILIVCAPAGSDTLFDALPKVFEVYFYALLGALIC
jgi:hypothetical protein